MLSKEGVRRNKHTNAEELKFPGSALLDQKDSLSLPDKEEDGVVELDTSESDVDRGLSRHGGHWNTFRNIRTHSGELCRENPRRLCK